MPSTKKCPECNGCMVKFWILPNRYYFCEFCSCYYGGRDEALEIVPKEIIYELMKTQQKE